MRLKGTYRFRKNEILAFAKISGKKAHVTKKKSGRFRPGFAVHGFGCEGPGAGGPGRPRHSGRAPPLLCGQKVDIVDEYLPSLAGQHALFLQSLQKLADIGAVRSHKARHVAA